MFSLKFTHSAPFSGMCRETTCTLYADEIVIGTGFSVCAPGDNFNKGTGRKIALTRALDDAELNRAARAEVWDLYLTKWGYRGSSRVWH